jgi:mRNA interferase RelE/StbE
VERVVRESPQKVEFRASAKASLRQLPESIRREIFEQILELRSDPVPAGSIKLEGLKGLFRIRVGGYRVVYRVTRSKSVIIERIRVADNRHRKISTPRSPASLTLGRRAEYGAVFLDLFGFGHFLVLVVAAGGVLAARGFEVRLPAGFGTDGESGDQLLQFLTLTRGTRQHRSLQDQQFELFAAGPAFVFVNGHPDQKS